jgi:hypothetical protein
LNRGWCRGEKIALFNREEPVAKACKRSSALAVGALGGDVANEKAERTGGYGRHDLLVELGQVKQGRK